LSGTTPKAAAHVNKYSGRPHQQARTTQAHIIVKPTFFFFVCHKVVGSQGSQLDRKYKTKSVSQNHVKHYLCAVHQPLRGFLVEIEDVLHNNFSENIKQACSEYKSSAAIFSSSLHICPIHIFSSRFDSTLEYQMGAYFLMLYFLTLLFCQLPIYRFPS
jgi:hypothetical protein